MLVGLARTLQEGISRCTSAGQLWRTCQALQLSDLTTSSSLGAPAEPVLITHLTSTPDAADPLQPFLAANAVSSSVKVLEGLPAPTALSWLRRRALAGVPAGQLYKAFRQRQVRVFDGKRVTRISKDRPLAAGEKLLFPKELLLQAQSSPRQQAALLRGSPPLLGQGQQPDQQPFTPPRMPGGSRLDAPTAPWMASQPGAAAAAHTPSRAQPAPAPTCPYALMPGQPPGLVDGAQVTTGMLRNSVLAVTEHAIFINKPAGLKVQGPGPALDSLMNEALRLGPSDNLRLVHRLDRNVSGVMAVARTQDAATWLAACFKEKDEQELDHAQDALTDEMGVRRVYWALLAGHITGRLSGRIRFPVIVDGRFKQAVTDFRVRHTSPHGLTWVELQPITGRKHQLRVHCARVLGAPIVGDVRYGYRGLDPSTKLAKLLPRGWWQAFSPTTAHSVLNPPTQRQRRQMAAARAEERRRSLGLGPRVQELSDAYGDDMPDEAHYPDDTNRHSRTSRDRPVASEAIAGSGISSVEQLPMPVFLHSRRMVLKLPRQEAARVKAPLPTYMAHAIQRMGWPLPPDT